MTTPSSKTIIACLLETGMLDAIPTYDEQKQILSGIQRILHVVRCDWQASDIAIGERLRELREEKGFSQERLRRAVNGELSKLVDNGLLVTNPSSLSKTETGKQSLKLLTAIAIARVLTGSTEGIIYLSPWKDDRMKCFVEDSGNQIEI